MQQQTVTPNASDRNATAHSDAIHAIDQTLQLCQRIQDSQASTRMLQSRCSVLRETALNVGASDDVPKNFTDLIRTLHGISDEIRMLDSYGFLRRLLHRSSRKLVIRRAREQIDALINRLKEQPNYVQAPIIAPERIECDLNADPVGRGGFGILRKGVLVDPEGRRPIVIKTFARHGSLDPDIHRKKRFIRETNIWALVHHENVLPLLGVVNLPGLPVALVSPWIPKGNCVQYLQQKSTHQVDRMPIILGVTRGLAYLHGESLDVVHGDLKGLNVLITDDGKPLLCDFGLAVVVAELTKMPISTSLRNAGSTRWMAPELLFEEVPHVTTQSDMWSLGMLFFEILTGVQPFLEIQNDNNVVLALSKKRRPSKPQPLRQDFSEQVWDVSTKCWALKPDDRPTVSEVLKGLELSPGYS